MNIKRIMVFAVFAAALMTSSAAFAIDEVGTVGGGIVPAGSAVIEGAFFEIKADKPSFTPSSITVKKGQKVTLKFISLDVDHSVDMSVFGLKEILIPEKESVTFEFTPNKTGTFSIPCKKYCGWRHLVFSQPKLEIKVVE